MPAHDHQSLSSLELTALTALAEELARKVTNVVELLKARGADHPAVPIAVAAQRHLIELAAIFAVPAPDQPRHLSAAAGSGDFAQTQRSKGS